MIRILQKIVPSSERTFKDYDTRLDYHINSAEIENYNKMTFSYSTNKGSSGSSTVYNDSDYKVRITRTKFNSSVETIWLNPGNSIFIEEEGPFGADDEYYSHYICEWYFTPKIVIKP